MRYDYNKSFDENYQAGLARQARATERHVDHCIKHLEFLTAKFCGSVNVRSVALAAALQTAIVFLRAWKRGDL